jgi:hypothetical protein
VLNREAEHLNDSFSIVPRESLTSSQQDFSATLRVISAGVCGSDLKGAVMKPYPRHPKGKGLIVAGHEGGLELTRIGDQLRESLEHKFYGSETEKYGIGRLFSLHIVLPKPGFPNWMAGFSDVQHPFALGTFANEIHMTEDHFIRALVPAPQNAPGYWMASREPLACCRRAILANVHEDKNGNRFEGLTPEGNVLLLGATGAMGAYMIEYLLRSSPKPNSITIAGKNNDKLIKMVERFQTLADEAGIELRSFEITDADRKQMPSDIAEAVKHNVRELKSFVGHRDFDDAMVMYPSPSLFTLAAKVIETGGCVNLFARPEQSDLTAHIFNTDINLSRLKGECQVINIEDRFFVSSSGATREDMEYVSQFPRDSGRLQVTSISDLNSLPDAILSNGGPEGSDELARAHLVMKTLVFPGLDEGAVPTRIKLAELLQCSPNSNFLGKGEALRELYELNLKSMGVFTDEMEQLLLQGFSVRAK